MLRVRILAAAMTAFCIGGAHAANDIGATGRIQPRDGVVVLVGVPGAVIQSIKIHAGDVVKRGDLLMILDDRDARSGMELAEISARQSAAAAKQSIADHALVLDRAMQRSARAQQLLKTYRDLGPSATSQRQIDDLEIAARDADTDLKLEQSRDIQIRRDAAATDASSANRLQLAKKQLADYRMASPIDATVLQIDQHVGERLNGGPAIELGDLTAMYVVCRVFQGDLLKISKGMRTTVRGGALTHPLTGTVDQIGRLIDTRAQLGEVKIKLDDIGLPSRLVGMEVEVQIAR